MLEVAKKQLSKRILISIFLQAIKLKIQKISNKAPNNSCKNLSNNLIARSKTLKLPRDNNRHYHNSLTILLNRKNCLQRIKFKMIKSYS